MHNDHALVTAGMDNTLCIANALDLKLIRLVATNVVLQSVCAPSGTDDQRVVAVGEVRMFSECGILVRV